MTINDFRNIQFQLVRDMPVISPPKFTPLIADPTFLTPDQSPDHKWHLFAHSIFGVQHYLSGNGIHWQKDRIAVQSAMRPFIYKEADTYYLLYEKYARLKLLFSFLPDQHWYSQIEMISSKDLIKWSPAKILIRPTLSFHQDKKTGEAVSNPCLIKTGNTYRLYFSASLVRIPDCGFNEPKYITYAESTEIDTNYISSPSPVISPSPENMWNNLGAGSMKVLACDDGFVAFQNGIYEHDGRSGSAICLLFSEDGTRWKYLNENPLLQPDSRIPWMSSHIYACDVRIFENKAYLYFNARDHAHWSKGKEHIGLAVAVI